jgi:hypothetical protein
MVVKMAVTEGGAHCKASTAANITGAAFLTQADLAVTAADPFQGRTGLVAWARNLRSEKSDPTEPGNASSIGFFISTTVGPKELDSMSRMCTLARKNGSGYGTCKSCKLGGISPPAH